MRPTGIVDQRVDAAEALQRLLDDLLRGRRIGDVAGNGQHIRIGGRLDRAGIGDDAIIAVAVTLDQVRADALRCAGDDDDFLFLTHDSLCDLCETAGLPPGRMAPMEIRLCLSSFGMNARYSEGTLPLRERMAPALRLASLLSRVK
jgi:hypothetical protein